MNILVSLDDNYLEQLLVMLNSLFKNNPKEKFTIFLLYGSLSNNSICIIRRFVEKRHHCLIDTKVNGSLFSNALKRAHTSIETYYRLLASYILDSKVKKILYLDPDMIVMGSLKSMYDIDLCDKCFAAVPDYGINELYKEHKRHIGMPSKCKYVNAGMLLMNLERIREKMTMDQLGDFLNKNIVRFKLQDQDVINSYFYNEIKYLPKWYNEDVWYHGNCDVLTYPIRKFIPIKKTMIIHYMGSEYKPWRKEGYGGKGIRDYLRYCNICEALSIKRMVLHNYKHWNKSYLRILVRQLNGEELCK